MRASATRSTRRPPCRPSTSRRVGLRGRSAGIRGRASVTRPKSTRFEDVAECFAEFCGITKQKEMEIVVDVLTNPASGFIDRKLANKYRKFQIREIDTEVHIKPVATYLREEVGCSLEQIRRVVLAYPPAISYSVDDHLRPLVSYLREVGVADVAQVLTSRPSLLGLRADTSLTKIVDWLQHDGHTKEQIVDYLCRTV